MLASAMVLELTRDDVAAIAALANLDLSPDELDLFTRQLGEVLAAAAELRQIDTAGVPPTAAPVAGAVERADIRQACLNRDVALESAPDPAPEAGFFRVPRVIG